MTSDPWVRPSADRADDVPTVHLPVVRDTLPVVALPPREGFTATIVVLVAMALLLGGIGTLGLSERYRAERNRANARAAMTPPTATPSPSPTPAGIRTFPPFAGLYLAPENLCQAADFTPLRPTFDRLGDLAATQGHGAGPLSYAQCDGSAGNTQVQGTFSLQVSVYVTREVAEQQFAAGMRAANQRAKVADLEPEISRQKGYVFLDPTAGPTVELYDGNLRIRLSWVAQPGADMVAGIFEVLMRTCVSTMFLLRDS